MATTQHLPPSKAGIKGQNLPSKSGTTTAHTPATKTGPTAQTPPTKTGPTVQTPPTKTGTTAKTVTVQDLFKKTLDKTHHWLNEIKEECGLKDIHQAYTLLRGVLLTIRFVPLLCNAPWPMAIICCAGTAYLPRKLCTWGLSFLCWCVDSIMRDGTLSILLTKVPTIIFVFVESVLEIDLNDADIKTKEDFFKIVIRHIAPSNLIENIECNMVGVLKGSQRILL